MYTYLQCMKKGILAYSTIMFGPLQALIPITIYITLEIISINYLITSKPLKYAYLNNMEIMNESFILLSSYHMLFYTGWMVDPEMRYDIGFVQLY